MASISIPTNPSSVVYCESRLGCVRLLLYLFEYFQTLEVDPLDRLKIHEMKKSQFRRKIHYRFHSSFTFRRLIHCEKIKYHRHIIEKDVHFSLKKSVDFSNLCGEYSTRNFSRGQTFAILLKIRENAKVSSFKVEIKTNTGDREILPLVWIQSFFPLYNCTLMVTKMFQIYIL